ncbi:Ankyrin repeat protein [Legionella moravica]|uniref:Ankyrin repeat n=1 Tax=Legionella moravica TaxID=39962 RepID=A0A378JUK9_9GAMM|nr:ankyrin repeat domain-containing protein [Legionella moravica]KTD37655.1 Ankyrin repeat protein [Legionella moravica]STX61700.1 Ankyrin repeat [Legionella moravica]HEN5528820.1 ankyrin repeat domain-containing protein [Legionella pneumophila]
MKEAAIEFLIYKPNPEHPVPEEQRGVVVNPHLKQRFKQQFLPIGVYLEGSDLRYYFFDQCDEAPEIYSSLDALKLDLPQELNTIFEKKPKLYIMGHASGGHYGMGNCHGPSEQLFGDHFDHLLNSLKQTLPADHGEVFVTLEGCNTDNQLNATENQQEKTFLERVSAKHREITFGGSRPWNAQEALTGARSLTPAAPITSMTGNVWKSGNSVIFHHGQYQIAVRKSLFASTQTAKELKINTIEYASAILGNNSRNELIAKIALNRDILTIQDLEKIDGFPKLPIEEENVSSFIAQEKLILNKEQEHYLARVRGILERAEPIDQLTDRDILDLLLGLKEPSVFMDHEYFLESILANKALLQLAIVSCGKVLVGGPSNDSLIDLLLKHGADINSADKEGMTALHYAVQNFYNYREEPLNLIKKLIDCGASLEVQNKKEQTPIDIAREHSQDGRVTASDKLLSSLKHDHSPPTPLEVKQLVNRIFQMSQHKSDELLSLPIATREYFKCRDGTLYIPEDVVEKLHGVLQSAKGNDELLSAFESELSAVISALERGIGTGEVFSEQDEFIPKCFMDVNLRLTSVMDTLIELKQDMAASKVTEPEIVFADHRPESC